MWVLEIFNIIGNLIGITSNSTANPNLDGIQIGSSSTGIANINISHNVISGNQFRGIYIFGQYDSSIWIEENFIGTNIDGTAARPNGGNGIQADNSSVIYIGTGSTGNLIAGNGGMGSIYMTATAYW